MGSDPKPESWGYGLTWLISIGLVIMVSFGVFKLTATAKESTKHLEAARKEAEAAGLKALAANNAEVDEKVKLEAAAVKIAAEAEITSGPAGDPVKGKALYVNCIACHMPGGQGNPAMKSPGIAGQEGWYLETSLNKFLKGIRGGDPAKDPQAGMMSMMVKQFLKTEEDVRDVVAYVKTLKPMPVQHTLKGNANLGKALYVNCLACHGDKGQGNPLTKGPKLTGLPDWYIVDQIKKFKTGVRGAHPEDLEGKMMVPMSMMLATDEMILNVTEYIKTFSKK